ncbi:MFS transporter [Pontivivens nitratireducens]|uniref:MFS transporter n=1 Tax=Pontivivens nitratireducens TaxID=2758038 RepID=A0A6G7VHP8_9RHOB|nr:MFS transporter [Pontibrevibacter nitratireducens]QIK39420.1 MFS transporter [Pontibrevibacter nitratireducens]
MIPSALTHRDFRIYVIGNFFGLNGVWIQRITISWLGWSLTDSASFVGILAFLMMLPTLIFGPFLGVIADRTDVRRAAIGTQAALFGVSLALMTAYFTDLLSAAVLAVCAVSIGLVTALHHPIRMAMAPRLVPIEAIGAAVPIISINFNLSRFLGPFIAGTLIATMGVGSALIVNAAAFVPLLFALNIIRPRPKSGSPTDRIGFLESFRDGIAHTRADPLILTGILVTAITSLSARGVQEILPVIADGAFARGASGLGQLTAAAGLGAMVSSISLARHPIAPADGLPRASLIGAAASLVLVIALAHAPYWWLALLCTAGLGAAGTQVGVGIQSAIQIRLDDDMRGRVMSLWTTTAIGATALGALALGAGADAFGLKPALVLAALLSATALGVVLLRYRTALRARASSLSRNRDRSDLENGLPPP